jgi:signal transduction histidine kinase
MNAVNVQTSTQDLSAPPQPVDLTRTMTTDLYELRHEVGNALAVASGYAQRLLRRLPENADTRDRQALEAIRESVERAMHLLDSAVTAPAANSTDLRALVARAMLEVPSHRRDDVNVQVLDSGSLAGEWDDERVVQVIVNLLQNAAKYSTRGTSIGVELGRFGPVAHVVVRDKGIGIAPEDQAAIFSGYRTGAAQRVAAGSGIGLRVSRRLAEEQGGRLWVTSAVGAGSAFYFALPLAPPTRCTSQHAVATFQSPGPPARK